MIRSFSGFPMGSIMSLTVGFGVLVAVSDGARVGFTTSDERDTLGDNDGAGDTDGEYLPTPLFQNSQTLITKAMSAMTASANRDLPSDAR